MLYLPLFIFHCVLPDIHIQHRCSSTKSWFNFLDFRNVEKMTLKEKEIISYSQMTIANIPINWISTNTIPECILIYLCT